MPAKINACSKNRCLQSWLYMRNKNYQLTMCVIVLKRNVDPKYHELLVHELLGFEPTAHSYLFDQLKKDCLIPIQKLQPNDPNGIRICVDLMKEYLKHGEKILYHECYLEFENTYLSHNKCLTNIVVSLERCKRKEDKSSLS